MGPLGSGALGRLPASMAVPGGAGASRAPLGGASECQSDSRAKTVAKNDRKKANMGPKMAPRWHPDRARMDTKCDFLELLCACPFPFRIFIVYSLFWHAPNHETYGNSYRKRSTGSLSDDFRQVVRWDPIWLLKTCHFAPLDGPIDEKSASTGHSKFAIKFSFYFLFLQGFVRGSIWSSRGPSKASKKAQDAPMSSPRGTQEAGQRIF